MTERRMTVREVLDAIERERARLEDALHAMGDRVSTEPVTDEGWTAKEVIGHLNHWVSQIAWGMGAPLQPLSYVTSVKTRPTGDGVWNELAVAYWRDFSFEKVKAEFDGYVDALIEQVKKRNDDQINATDAIPWAGVRPLWRQIGSETFEHRPEHAESIERAAAKVAR